VPNVLCPSILTFGRIEPRACRSAPFDLHPKEQEPQQVVLGCLPRRAKVTTREDLAGVDSQNFTRCAAEFVLEVCDLAENGRKCLLMYDGYRSHLCFKALSILRDGGVIAHALPAHTSGKTKPLDVSIFSPFKAKLNDGIHSIAMTNSAMTHDVFDFCKLVTEAYKQVFTEATSSRRSDRLGYGPLIHKWS
jgi:hypothetical protein